MTHIVVSVMSACYGGDVTEEALEVPAPATSEYQYRLRIPHINEIIICISNYRAKYKILLLLQL